MPLTPDFLHHLHELMVEVSDSLADTEAAYKAELLWKARMTHNAAATPIAYKDAAIHAFETRVGKTIERYVEAVSIWGIEVTPAVEKAMANQFVMLTAGPTLLHFPPALQGHQVQAVQGAYVRERARVANRLVRQGTNRLRELKMKTKQATPLTHATYNIAFNAPVQNAYVDSVHNVTSHVEIDMTTIQDMDSISEGHAHLKNAAQEIRAAYPDKPSMLEKAQKWVMLLGGIEGLTEKAIQHGPQMAALITNLRHISK